MNDRHTVFAPKKLRVREEPQRKEACSTTKGWFSWCYLQAHCVWLIPSSSAVEDEVPSLCVSSSPNILLPLQLFPVLEILCHGALPWVFLCISPEMLFVFFPSRQAWIHSSIPRSPPPGSLPCLLGTPLLGWYPAGARAHCTLCSRPLCSSLCLRCAAILPHALCMCCSTPPSALCHGLCVSTSDLC